MPVTLVLVRTHSHGNLGSCARTARALGAGLVLVAPVADRAHPDASAFASGADELLAAAPVVEGLE
ncbi:MAG: RNA methyltransferase, partial [Acidobacteria bacterium ACB2]|nr:RNA methyltransferase [Acidobacteria bacterium ACB2]